jgi:dipeptidyl aminopeptidase/acylaminoacyl peptidase
MRNALILFTLLSAATLVAAQESSAPPSRYEFFPAWSPDGSMIAFVSDRDGNWEIYTKNADGSGLTRLTHNDVRDSHPVWSPTGSHIYYYSDVTGNREVFALKIGETEPVNLTNHPARDGVLYSMLADGSEPVNLTNHAARDRWPAWAPDGTRIIFNSDRDQDDGTDLYVMRSDGSDVSRLTNMDGDIYDAEWSPDGSRIVFTAATDESSDIYVMNAAGGNAINLTKGRLDALEPTWTPDGSLIGYVGVVNNEWRIYTMAPDDTSHPGPRIADIAWLQGHWHGIGDDGETTGATDSIWTNEVEGVMSLTFRWHQPVKNHVHFAFSVVEQTHDGVFLRGIHHGRDFGTFEDANWTMRLADAGPDTARFDCIENCRAASVEFKRLPDGELVESWRAIADAKPVFVVTYQKRSNGL